MQTEESNSEFRQVRPPWNSGRSASPEPVPPAPTPPSGPPAAPPAPEASASIPPWVPPMAPNPARESVWGGGPPSNLIYQSSFTSAPPGGSSGLSDKKITRLNIILISAVIVLILVGVGIYFAGSSGKSSTASPFCSDLHRYAEQAEQEVSVGNSGTELGTSSSPGQLISADRASVKNLTQAEADLRRLSSEAPSASISSTFTQTANTIQTGMIVPLDKAIAAVQKLPPTASPTQITKAVAPYNTQLIKSLSTFAAVPTASIKSQIIAACGSDALKP